MRFSVSIEGFMGTCDILGWPPVVKGAKNIERPALSAGGPDKCVF